jgi:hypothetical protein
MINPPNGNAPRGPWPTTGSSTGEPTAWPPVVKQSRAPVGIALVVSGIAVAVAIGAWIRPASTARPEADAAPKFSDQQVEEAKTNVCAAYDKVVKASSGAAGLSTDDPATKFSISVNSRLASEVASNYLIKTLGENLATPLDLSDGIRGIASAYDDVVLGQLSGEADEETKPAYDRLDAADKAVASRCK